MTNEQREAVEICKEKIIEPFYNFPNPISIELKDTDVGAIETILSLIKEQQEEMEKKDKIIKEIQEELRDHIGFENRLKRENKEPDLFNQGRFYVANNINNILKGRLKMITEYKVNLEKKTKDELVAFISQLQSLLIKQAKQIDLMADFIGKYHCFSVNVFNIDNECEEEHKCKDCIKQYFAGLVEKE